MDNAELAALAAQYESEEDEIINDAPADEVAEDVDYEDDQEDDQEEEAEENPPGFIDNIEDWIAAGNDPDKFRGKAAYKDEYKRIQEIKEMNNKFKEMQETLKSTVDAISRRDEQVAEQHRKELEEALRLAREDGDTDAALDAHEKLQAIKTAPKPRAENPVIGEFFSTNPVLESPEIKAEFARIYNGKLKNDGVSIDEPLSDAAIRGYLRASMESVKSIFQDRFESPRHERKSKPQLKAKPATKPLDVDSALRAYKVEGASPRNQSAAYDIYAMLKKTSPAAAESYAKNLLRIK